MYDKPDTHVVSDVDFSFYIKSELKTYNCELGFIELYVNARF